MSIVQCSLVLDVNVRNVMHGNSKTERVRGSKGGVGRGLYITQQTCMTESKEDL